MSAHTPGPWTIGTLLSQSGSRMVFMPDDRVEIRGAHPGRALVAALYRVNCSTDGSVDRANARLIASAPELLDAASTLLLACEQADELTDLMGPIKHLREVIRTAAGEGD